MPTRPSFSACLFRKCPRRRPEHFAGGEKASGQSAGPANATSARTICEHTQPVANVSDFHSLRHTSSRPLCILHTMAQASAMYPDMMMWYPDFEPPPKPMLRRSSSQKWGPYATHNFDRDEMKSLAALKAYQNMPAARARNIKDSVGEALWVTGDAQRKAEMSKQNRRVRKVRGFACVCILPDSVLTVVLRVDARRIFARPTTSPTLTAPPSSRAGGATSPLHGSPGRRTRS